MKYNSADDVRREARTRTEAEANKEEFNPFWHAQDVAKSITSRNPREDEPQLHDELASVVDMLSDDEKSKVVFRLVLPVLSEDVGISSLFALARACKMTGVAHATGAVLAVKRAEGLTVPDLAEFGLVELKVSDDGERSWFQVYLGKERIRDAASKLQDAERFEGAKALRRYLEHAAQARAKGIARRDAQSAEVTTESDNVFETAAKAAEISEETKAQAENLLAKLSGDEVSTEEE